MTGANPLDRSVPGPVPEGIAVEIACEGGRVTFARFMELALTHPTEGYYSRIGGRSGPLLGRRGHFSTAPHLSPAFCRAVGRLLTELVDASLASQEAAQTAAVKVPTPAAEVAPTPSAVVELGGGEGDLAAAILQAWEEARKDLRERIVYVMVEIGKSLRARQREAVAGQIARGWQVCWAEELAAAAVGTRPAVVIGNEFVDALPVHVVDVRGPRPLEAWVRVEEGRSGGLREEWDELSEEAAAELQLLFGSAGGRRLREATRDGIIELRPAVAALMSEVVSVISQGCLLTIDYGAWLSFGEDAGAECLCPQPARATYGRTLRGYFRHQLVTDPYARIGQQDLTADVDFRALDLHGRDHGFETVLYTSLAGLLLANGGEGQLRSLQARAGVSLEADREAAVLGALLDETDLGGAYKLMLQVKE